MSQILKKAILVDASWCLHRFYHVFRNITTEYNGNTIPSGVPYGFARLAQTLWQPDFCIIFCLDEYEQERGKIIPTYKSNRTSKPEVYADLAAAIHIVSLLPGVSAEYAKGKEADDVIAMRAFQLKEEGYEVWIYSGDNDFLQLHAQGIHISDKLQAGSFDEKGAEYIREKFEVEPEHLLHFRSIVGDTSDNIAPAVPRLNRDIIRKFVVDWAENSFGNALELIEKDNHRQKFVDAKEAIIDNLRVMSLLKYRKPENHFPIQEFEIKDPVDGVRFVDRYSLAQYWRFVQKFVN